MFVPSVRDVHTPRLPSNFSQVLEDGAVESLRCSMPFFEGLSWFGNVDLRQQASAPFSLMDAKLSFWQNFSNPVFRVIEDDVINGTYSKGHVIVRCGSIAQSSQNVTLLNVFFHQLSANFTPIYNSNAQTLSIMIHGFDPAVFNITFVAPPINGGFSEVLHYLWVQMLG